MPNSFQRAVRQVQMKKKSKRQVVIPSLYVARLSLQSPRLCMPTQENHQSHSLMVTFRYNTRPNGPYGRFIRTASVLGLTLRSGN